MQQYKKTKLKFYLSISKKTLAADYLFKNYIFVEKFLGYLGNQGSAQ